MKILDNIRKEPISYLVCYSLMATALVILYRHTSVSLVQTLAAGLGVFSSTYVSFAIQRRDIDGTRLTTRKRLSYVVSALTFALLYCRFGFPDVFAGAAWIYVTVSLMLFLIGSPLIKDQDGDSKPGSVMT